MRGLRAWASLAPTESLFLERTRSVHTFGMRFPIAAVLLDAGLTVIRVKPMLPGRLLLPRPRVRHVLECPLEADLRSGDVLVAE